MSNGPTLRIVHQGKLAETLSAAAHATLPKDDDAMNTMDNQRPKWQLPVQVEDFQNLKFYDPNDPDEVGETIFDVDVGATPFRLYCDDRDPDQVLRHAVAAIQIFHSVFLNNPAQRARQAVNIAIDGVGTLDVIASHRNEVINVFAHGKSHLTIELTSPLKWKDHGLSWLLEQPTAGAVKALIAYLRSHPLGPGRVPVQIGSYISWNAALEYAGLQLDDGWGND